MKDRYFKHDLFAREDDKLRKIIFKHGMSGYGLFWHIIEKLFENEAAILLDYDDLAWSSRMDKVELTSIIDSMIEINLLQIEGEYLENKRVKIEYERTKNIIENRRESGRKGGTKTNKNKPLQANAKQVLSKCLKKSKQSNLILSNLISSNLINNTQGEQLQEWFDYRLARDKSKPAWSTERGLKSLITQLNKGTAGGEGTVGWHNLSTAIDFTSSKNWADLYLPTNGIGITTQADFIKSEDID